MKKFAKKAIRELFNHSVRRHYDKAYRRLLKLNNILNKPCEGEDKWIEKWSVLGNANPVFYRLYSHYIGYDINILPEDICHYVIEPILNPKAYIPYYADKNIFDKLFKDGTMPKTIFRKMDGFLYDADYRPLVLSNAKVLALLNSFNYERIIVKPTIDTDSGKGVRLYIRNADKWEDIKNGELLSLDSLNEIYGPNYIVQEALTQIEDLAQYNPSSVNTIRLTVYRSVKDNECYIPSAIFRIGAKGEVVDNGHSGGKCIGIHSDGTLYNKVLNQYGETTTEFNGVDFSQEHKIPNWREIVEFAKYVGRNIPHHRLLALDIMLDKKGCPRLIEYNIKSCSVWLFQLTSSSVFGEFTDEVIGYCKNNLDKAQMVITL